ncbi:GGDEF domain-containing protein [Parahaliea mediterranea]|uniref:diguanylate cyclase n=1 Tax=Parahaliea mediterranea TaxID=651086 RepID=A0A939IHH4_9GAMM|nr:diguanylate cyclase [Parahaliea mediterranea]MBN7795449.1 diguanylate cyclase [Parahaliea mediterranea]
MNGFIGKKNPELEFERIQILFAYVKAGYIGVASAIAMLYFIAAEYASPQMARYWLLAVAVANIPRGVVSFLFGRRKRAGRITPGNIRYWDVCMSISSVFAYAGFAAAIFLPYGEHAGTATVLCAFAFMTLSTGGVLVVSTSMPQILSYLSLVIFAIVVRFLFLPETIYSILAIILLFGYLQILKLTIRQHRILIENISLKIENKNSSLVDPLTQLANRRRLALHTEKLVPAARRSGEPFCLIILDIDDFKIYNDTHGHAAGDRVLTEVADTLRSCSREQDLVVRYGGEEFLVVLPQTALPDAARIAERILATTKTRTDVTASAGVAGFSQHSESFEHVLAEADEALYQAKSAGRDRFVVAHDVIEEPAPARVSMAHPAATRT